MLSITIGAAPFADPGPVLVQNVSAGMHEAVALLEAATKRETPIGVTEAARGSIAGEVRMGQAIGVGLPAGVVGSPLKHVDVINTGRRPGQKPPPVEALELWVRRKVRIERVHATGKKAGQVKTRLGKRLVRAPTVTEARGIAFVIARSIGAKGIEGRHFFEKAIEANTSQLQRIFDNVGLRITVDLTRGK
ncbi:hypothetical protein [Longimicrobium sp.]|uniref:hypothetical protein n=1 Tax=Longimicrobium sp. TaxID=2029185 RepID=UPI002EDA9340